MVESAGSFRQYCPALLTNLDRHAPVFGYSVEDKEFLPQIAVDFKPVSHADITVAAQRTAWTATFSGNSSQIEVPRVSIRGSNGHATPIANVEGAKFLGFWFQATINIAEIHAFVEPTTIGILSIANKNLQISPLLQSLSFEEKRLIAVGLSKAIKSQF